MKLTNLKRRLLSVLLTCCIITSGICLTQNIASAKSSTPAYEKAYQKILNNKDKVIKIGNKKYKRKNYKYYKMIDINGDGVKELILSKEKGEFLGEDTPVLLLTYVDGKVKPLKAFNHPAGMKVMVNHKRLVIYTRMAGEAHLKIYKLDEKGKLTKKLSIDHYQPYHYIEDTPKDVYLKNGEKCKKKEFTKLWDKYYQKQLTFKKIK